MPHRLRRGCRDYSSLNLAQCGRRSLSSTRRRIRNWTWTLRNWGSSWRRGGLVSRWRCRGLLANWRRRTCRYLCSLYQRGRSQLRWTDHTGRTSKLLRELHRFRLGRKCWWLCQNLLRYARYQQRWSPIDGRIQSFVVDCWVCWVCWSWGRGGWIGRRRHLREWGRWVGIASGLVRSVMFKPIYSISVK